MNRRDALKCMALPAVGAVLNTVARPLWAAEPGIGSGLGPVGEPGAGPAPELVPALAAFQEMRFGCCYHFSVDTFVDKGEYSVGTAPVSLYDPTDLDVRQWIRVARDLGAKYAVITAKFWSGFCLWDSKGYDYDVAATRNKTDVVAAFVAACKEYGIKPGFYYCIMDPRNEGKFDWDAPISDKYFELIKHHVTELHSTYPNTCYQLFDIPWKASLEQRWELYRLVKSYSPNCIIVNNQGFKQSRVNQGRFCEPGSWPTDVINGEDTLPPLEGHDAHVAFEKKTYYMPFETWLPTGPLLPSMPWMHSWVWHPYYKPQPAEVIAEAYRLVMKGNSNLLLNMAPDKTGRIPEDQVETFRRVAELIRA